MAKAVLAWLLAALMAWSAWQSLADGEALSRGLVLRRDERPVAFWMVVGVQMLVGAALLVLAVVLTFWPEWLGPQR